MTFVSRKQAAATQRNAILPGGEVSRYRAELRPRAGVVGQLLGWWGAVGRVPFTIFALWLT